MLKPAIALMSIGQGHTCVQWALCLRVSLLQNIITVFDAGG